MFLLHHVTHSVITEIGAELGTASWGLKIPQLLQAQFNYKKIIEG